MITFYISLLGSAMKYCFVKKLGSQLNTKGKIHSLFKRDLTIS